MVLDMEEPVRIGRLVLEDVKHSLSIYWKWLPRYGNA
jgi:hypothetical protein